MRAFRLHRKSSSAARVILEANLGACLNRAIRGCAKDPTLIFPGCPEIAQLAWRALDALGFGLDAVIVQGRAMVSDGGGWVDHIWIEIPKLELRVETNASQILGMPMFVAVMDLTENEERYRDAFENMEILDRVTAEGEKFYGRMAGNVARCVMSRASKNY